MKNSQLIKGDNFNIDVTTTKGIKQALEHESKLIGQKNLASFILWHFQMNLLLALLPQIGGSRGAYTFKNKTYESIEKLACSVFGWGATVYNETNKLIKFCLQGTQGLNIVAKSKYNKNFDKCDESEQLVIKKEQEKQSNINLNWLQNANEANRVTNREHFVKMLDRNGQIKQEHEYITKDNNTYESELQKREQEKEQAKTDAANKRAKEKKDADLLARKTFTITLAGIEHSIVRDTLKQSEKVATRNYIKTLLLEMEKQQALISQTISEATELISK